MLCGDAVRVAFVRNGALFAVVLLCCCACVVVSRRARVAIALWRCVVGLFVFVCMCPSRFRLVQCVMLRCAMTSMRVACGVRARL